MRSKNRLIATLIGWLALVWGYAYLAIMLPYLWIGSFLRLQGYSPSADASDILLVALDERTINGSKFKRFQDIDRCDYASLIRNLLQANAKLVVFDVVFWGTGNPACDDELTAIAKTYRERLIFWTELDPHSGQYLKILSFSGNDVWYVDTVSNSWFQSQIVHWPDIKNAIPVYSNRSEVLPIALEAYRRLYANSQPYSVTDQGVRFGNGVVVPLANGSYEANFLTSEFEKLSFSAVLDNSFPSPSVSGKIVFVGATAADIHDTFYTPIDTGSFLPWVLIHMNAFESVRKGRGLIYETIWWFLILQMLLIAAFVFVMSRFEKIAISTGIGALLAVSATLGQYLAFRSFWYVSALPFAWISFAAVVLSEYLYRYLAEKRSKDALRKVFSKYVSEDVAAEVIRKGEDELQLGGYQDEITVFFSDLAGFTDLSENLKPDELGKILNVYFEAMSSVILDKRWTIDKFIGDAIMAFWNAPIRIANHATLACESAILQREALMKVRTAIKAMWVDTLIDMRIGINTGKAVIGNFGCSMRYDYTALGDTVNLSSRLESINKQYGTNIIISESTYLAVDMDRFLVRELDTITVKGKTEPIRIYELIGLNPYTEAEKLDLYKNAFAALKAHKYDEATQAFRMIGDTPSRRMIDRVKEVRTIDLYAEALAEYRNRNFGKAKELFAQINDSPSIKFIERCEEFEKHPPEKDWDGVYRFKTK